MQAPPEAQEIQLLREVERNLVSVVDRSDIDPKVEVILHPQINDHSLESCKLVNLYVIVGCPWTMCSGSHQCNRV
jgi:hypothetical protein